MTETATQADWGNGDRWLIDSHRLNSGSREWHVWYSEGCGDPEDAMTFWSFAEAHAAYLDAVTCDAQTPFAYYTEPRCSRARGHEGAHRFESKNPANGPLRVNPK